MCGIVLHVTEPGTTPDRNHLTDALDSVRHRGPDDSDARITENIGMAHCRLSILDLSERGRQPMTHQPSGWSILYNGEIYNFQDLRRDLEEEGYAFQSDTDTEILLKGWVEWGNEVFERLNGMYAAVFIHPETNRIAAIRDRFGTKPLYVRQKHGRLTLASEQKAIFSLMRSTPVIDPDGLNEYLTFQNVLSQRTLVNDVHTLEPGVLHEFDAGEPDHPPRETPIEQIEFTNTFEGTRDEAVEELRTKLRSAVEHHLVSDVPVHAYLSGGMDTSTICVLAEELSPYTLNTFTIGFDVEGVEGKEGKYDERASARTVAEAIAAEHHEDEVTADTLQDVLVDLVRHLEEPRVGHSYPNYKAAELASKHGKAVLSGTGGDELFGGYPWRYQIAWNGPDPEENKRGLYRYWNRLFTLEERKKIISAELHDEIRFDRPRRLFRNWLNDLPYDTGTKEGLLQTGFHIDTEFFLRGLLHVEDKLGMRFGLEARFPFLDRDLFDLATSIPPSWKVDPFHGEQKPGEYVRGNNGKRILREAMEQLLPEPIKRREKQGFSGPYARWQQNEQRTFIQDRIRQKSGMINPDDGRSIEDKSKKNRLIPWSLLSLNTFQDQFLSF